MLVVYFSIRSCPFKVLKYKILILLLLILFPVYLHAREREYKTKYGKIFIEKFLTSPFPHKDREKGYTYQKTFYDAKTHYSSRSSIIYIPNGIKRSSRINLVFYFHGWNDRLHFIPPLYRVISQFAASRKNAILVIPQGPRAAPDSFWGKFEDKAGFKRYVHNVVARMYKKGRVPSNRIGNLILAGHSGAYRVIAYILMRGEMSRKIREVYLFDALYGEMEKYIYWFSFYGGRFVNLFTENPKVMQTSMRLIEDLDGWNVPYLFKKEKEIQDKEYKENRILFILSQKKHNEVMHGVFYKLLRTGSLSDL
ncbi:MAG: hypothetical protein AAF518_14980 [Spirochaetota bacterium]